MQLANKASRLISSDQVNGTAVFSLAGEKLGSIDTLMINKASGQVRYAILEFGAVLVIGPGRYPLPWNALTYDPAKEGYVVSISKEQLKEAPRHPSGDTVPEFSDDYCRKIHDYYGVPWKA